MNLIKKQIIFFKNHFSKYVFDNINKLSQKKFVRNVVTVASGTAMMQVISVLLSPIITRIYGPEALGVYGTFISVASIVTPISALTFPIAIVLPSNDKEAKDIGLLSYYTSILTSIIMSIFILLAGESITQLLNLEIPSGYLLMIPLMMFISSLMQIFNQWLIRKKEFRITARAGILNSLFMNISYIGLGTIAPTAGSLIIIYMISQGFHVGLLALSIGFLSLANIDRFKAKSDIFFLLKKYKEFPLFRTPQTIIDAISSNLPILMLTTLFGPTAAGFYTMGNKVLRVPVSLIGNAVGDVFYPRVSQGAHNKEKISGILIKATLILAVIGIVPFSILIIWGPDLFSLVFGSEWRTAGIYARWMAIWVYTSLINLPSVRSLPVLNSQRFHLFHTVITILFKIVALWLGAIVFKKDIIAIALYSVVAAALNIYLILYSIYRARKVEIDYI